MLGTSRGLLVEPSLEISHVSLINRSRVLPVHGLLLWHLLVGLDIHNVRVELMVEPVCSREEMVFRQEGGRV